MSRKLIKGGPLIRNCRICKIRNILRMNTTYALCQNLNSLLFTYVVLEELQVIQMSLCKYFLWPNSRFGLIDIFCRSQH